MSERPEEKGETGAGYILFLCGHNAGRSIMAEAYFNARSPAPGVRAVSAGTDPGATIDPEVRRLLEAEDIPTAGLRPKALSDEVLAAAKAVYTMGCNVSCQRIPAGKLMGDFGLDDPEGRPSEEVAAIFETLKSRMKPVLDAFN